MNIQKIIEMLAQENISLRLNGEKLRVSCPEKITPEDRDFLLRHKTQLMAYLREQVPLVDLFGRRQCTTCDQWAHNRCNHSKHTGRNCRGRPTYYRPDSEQWVRCKFHSMNNERP